MSKYLKVERRKSTDIKLDYIEWYISAVDYEKVADKLLSIMPVYQTINGITSRERIKKRDKKIKPKLVY